jgi:DNA polymerase beta
MTSTIDFKKIIIDSFDILRIDELKNKQIFKANAYKKVIQELKNYNKPIYSMDDLSEIRGIGEKIRTKIEEIFKTGKLIKAEKVKDNITEELLKIYGIGPSKVNELINKHNIKSITELRNKQELLNDKQKIGLKYYEDLQLRIPRDEMDEHKEYIISILKYISPNFQIEILGSYRRGNLDSGDIDVLITHPNKEIINDDTLMERIIVKGLNKRYNYITDILAIGSKKCLGICKLDKYEHYRRIDLLLTPPEEYPFALLYFTGNDKFNVDLRIRATEMGYTLSEHGIKEIKTDKYIEGLKSEKEILKFLKMDYIEPNMRK